MLYMYIYLNIGLMLLSLFFFMMLLFFYFILLKMKIFIELNLFLFNSMNYSLMIYFDYKSILFISIVMMISSMIVFYSIEYMSMDIYKIRFIYVLLLFVMSMLFMIIGQNLLMILLGWDGLGLISYYLVIYYNNWNSYNSGMITILTNRLGDIGLLFSISLISIYGDFNFLMIKMNSSLFLLMILMACFTKSAQIPFSSWLPMAMAAPTPISSLVHSSTLVTAGVYLLIRLKSLLMLNLFLNNLILFLSVMTMFFSGLIASFENDLKKIIALSTLSQLGLMMMILIFGFSLLSFFHLIIHALFKSLLFMCAGLILHMMFNNQDIRFLGGMNLNYLFTLMMLNCSSLCLCGFPFLSGFYSKDFILEMMIFLNLNYFLMIMFYISIMFTIIYSFRLIYYMIMNYMKFYMFFNNNDNMLMNFSMLLMFLMSIYGGSSLNYLIFYSFNFLFINLNFKLLLIFFFLFSLNLGLILNLIINKFNIFKLMSLFNFMVSLWMMNYFSNFYIKNILSLSNLMFINLDKGWFENLGGMFIKMIYLNFMKIEKFNNLLMM